MIQASPKPCQKCVPCKMQNTPVAKKNSKIPLTKNGLFGTLAVSILQRIFLRVSNWSIFEATKSRKTKHTIHRAIIGVYLQQFWGMASHVPPFFQMKPWGIVENAPRHAQAKLPPICCTKSTSDKQFCKQIYLWAADGCNPFLPKFGKLRIWPPPTPKHEGPLDGFFATEVPVSPMQKTTKTCQQQ